MKIKGVNLGNWLVLEKWMSSELFFGTKAEDEEGFYSSLSREEAALRLKMHRDYFICERDFHHIRSMGFRLVRIPVPHYIFDTNSRYAGCVDYLDKAFDWAEKYGIMVLVDLHTVPDGQNGMDNSGISGVVKWHLKPENISYTLDVLEKLAERYKNRESLYGIELLNEPISEDMWNRLKKRYQPSDPKRAEGSSFIPSKVLRDFYEMGYARVRRHCDESVAVVLHDGFRLDEWDDFMISDDYRNIIFDTHMYLRSLEKNMSSYTLTEYMEFIENGFEKSLKKAGKYHKILVGEWCLANRCIELVQAGPALKKQIYRLIGDMQMKAWESSAGWIFWNYKLFTPNRSDWDVCRAVDEGWLVPDGR